MDDVLGNVWAIGPHFKLAPVAGPRLCHWCWLEMKPGDQHGVIEASEDGGATVNCRVMMMIQLPRHRAQISGIPAPQGEEG